MSGVCSAHQYTEPGCAACTATPAMVLDITEEELNQRVAEAEAAGLGSCRSCGFEQYKNHDLCVKCGAESLEDDVIDRR